MTLFNNEAAPRLSYRWQKKLFLEVALTDDLDGSLAVPEYHELRSRIEQQALAHVGGNQRKLMSHEAMSFKSGASAAACEKLRKRRALKAKQELRKADPDYLAGVVAAHNLAVATELKASRPVAPA